MWQVRLAVSSSFLLDGTYSSKSYYGPLGGTGAQQSRQEASLRQMGEEGYAIAAGL